MTARTLAYVALLIGLTGVVALGVGVGISRLTFFEAELEIVAANPEVDENPLADVPDFTVLAYRYGPTERLSTMAGGSVTTSVSEGCVDYAFAGTAQTSCVAINVIFDGRGPIATLDALENKDVSERFAGCMRRVTIGLRLPECWLTLPPYDE